MSIIKHVTLQTIVAHDFRYDPRSYKDVERKDGSGALGGIFPVAPINSYESQSGKLINQNRV